MSEGCASTRMLWPVIHNLKKLTKPMVSPAGVTTRMNPRVRLPFGWRSIFINFFEQERLRGGALVCTGSFGGWVMSGFGGRAGGKTEICPRGSPRGSSELEALGADEEERVGRVVDLVERASEFRFRVGREGSRGVWLVSTRARRRRRARPENMTRATSPERERERERERQRAPFKSARALFPRYKKDLRRTYAALARVTAIRNEDESCGGSGSEGAPNGE